MSGRHASSLGTLHHPGDSAVHRLPAEAKVAAAALFVVAVVATPRHALWAFAVDGLVLGLVLVASGLPGGVVARRLRIELPFLAFALFLPLVGGTPHVEVLGVGLSQPGLWAAWNIAVKGTLGVLAAVVLAGTTSVDELLAGLRRLRVPSMLVAVASFMARYLHVIVGEAERMHVARISRGHDPRWLWQARAVAATGGALFVRAYERGERVHLAMLSRGYTGSMPVLHHHAAPVAGWALAAVLPALGVAVSVAAHTGV